MNQHGYSVPRSSTVTMPRDWEVVDWIEQGFDAPGGVDEVMWREERAMKLWDAWCARMTGGGMDAGFDLEDYA